MIKQYTHTHIKGTMINEEFAPVTLVNGANRSGKSAIMAGLALAASGKCDAGARADKLKAIVSAAEATVALHTHDNRIATWAYKDGSVKRKCNIEFTELIEPGQFWELTGEKKFELIGSLCSGGLGSEHAQLIAKYHCGPGDLIANAQNAQGVVDNKLAECRARIDNLAQSLQPPAPYEGEPLSVLNKKRFDIELQVNENKKAAAYWQHVPSEEEIRAAKARRQSEIEAMTAGHNESVDRMSAMRDARSELDEMCRKLLSIVHADSKLIRECRTNSPRDVLGGALTAAMANLIEVCKAISHFDPVNLVNLNCNILSQMEQDIEQIVGNIVPELPVNPIGAPIEVEQIKNLVHSVAPSIHIGSIDDAICATNLMDHEMKILGGSIVASGARIAGLVRDVEQLEAKQSEKHPYPKPLDGEDLIAKVRELDAINKQILLAQEWPAFEQRQAKATAEIEALRKKLVELSADRDTIRAVRAGLLQAAIGPVEDIANKFLHLVGIEPLKVVVETKGRFSSVTITTQSDVDISAFAGSEKVLYSLALLGAIHELTPNAEPLRLVEAAELDGYLLGTMLNALVESHWKGTTVVATHVKPSVELNPAVKVVQCL